MIAMQYTFVLPQTFDMKNIHQRISEHGSKLNGFPHLGFKAYMVQEQNNHDDFQHENRYAPFYFWDSSEGLRQFLMTEGYSRLEQDFGRPAICTYLPFIYKQTEKLKATQYAWTMIEKVSRNTEICELKRQQERLLEQLSHLNMTAYICALNTKDWTLHTWLFFEDSVTLQKEDCLFKFGEKELTHYQVGYIAQ